MRLLGHFAGIPLLALAPILLLFAQVSALIVPRSDINASLVPATCTSTCQPALSFQSNCGSDVKCRCTNANANSFAQCIDCVVGTNPDSLAQNAGQSVLSGERPHPFASFFLAPSTAAHNNITEFASDCAQNGLPVSSLTLSFATPTASSTVVRTSASLIYLPPWAFAAFAAGLQSALVMIPWGWLLRRGP
ncbi:hypothetical protein MSAN_01965100 [Mycena sanguinolenta]|uniref:Extracellular membrane protein CFEM domain-containing protein n=1 Tax=Mycena sanguinolenta TaxID=230812 RepID=A0A8H7CN34_9AGAR|nr:hypothetical protein MSAN_01965100 [Mycena sanguinolenta]